MPKQRTIPQNSALHLYLERLAEALDDAGYDMREVIKVPIKPTKENVKSEMLHPVMRAMYPDKKSTTELSTVEMQELYEVMNRFTAERWGVSIPWPSEESLHEEFQSTRRQNAL